MTQAHLMCVRSLLLVSFLVSLSAAASAQDEATNLIGTWRGSSICSDRERAPACKDEEIIYTFRSPSSGEPRKAILKADKVVNGEIVPMGEMEISYNADSKRWESELKSPRFHGLWSFACTGLELSGTLIDLPSKAVLRKVTARKQ
jgi:hypothetical protein